MLQSLTNYTNGIIIIHLSESIELNFDLALNKIEFSIRVTFCYFFVCTGNQSKCKWRTWKITDTSFLNLIANLFKIKIFRFILLWELCWRNRFNYFVNRINWKLEEATMKIVSVLLSTYNKNDWILFIVIPIIFHLKKSRDVLIY